MLKSNNNGRECRLCRLRRFTCVCVSMLVGIEFRDLLHARHLFCYWATCPALSHTFLLKILSFELAYKPIGLSWHFHPYMSLYFAINLFPFLTAVSQSSCPPLSASPQTASLSTFMSPVFQRSLILCVSPPLRPLLTPFWPAFYFQKPAPHKPTYERKQGVLIWICFSP